jgi:hypothetical protein
MEPTAQQAGDSMQGSQKRSYGSVPVQRSTTFCKKCHKERNALNAVRPAGGGLQANWWPEKYLRFSGHILRHKLIPYNEAAITLMVG